MKGGVEGSFLLLTVGGEEGLRPMRVGPVRRVSHLHNVVHARRAAIRAIVAVSTAQPGKHASRFGVHNILRFETSIEM